MLMNEWPEIDDEFYRNEVLMNYVSLLTRIVGNKELYDSIKVIPPKYKLQAGETTILSLLERLGR